MTDQVEEYFKSIGGKAYSPFIGDVVLDRNGADDSLAHGMGRLKASAYAAVGNVIEKGIVIDADINHKGRGYNTVVIAAPVEIDNARHICMVVVRRNLKGNRYYLHEVILQEKLLDEGSNTVQKQPQHPIAVANILQNILSAKDDVTKVVDENGEPNVVYKRRPDDSNVIDAKFGAFFSNEPLKDLSFGKNVTEVFLNIKNPLRIDAKY
ncbi:MAG: hypothetical protein IKR18_10840 [Bacteroidaceae bacterium]|nr:hypothetical protein [Bacteroidaceae bacterium]